MTEERSNNVTDPLVSRTYRESANETAPEALDDAVLRKATQAATPNAWDRYSKSIHWLRPMAWAATVALSLAIVIEVTDSPYLSQDRAVQDELHKLEVPQTDSVPAAPGTNLPELHTAPARSEPISAGGASGLSNQRAQDDQAPASFDAAGRIGERVDANAANGDAALRRQSPESKVEVDRPQVTIEGGLTTDAAPQTVDTEMFRSQDTEMLKEAEEQMRQRAAEQPTEAPVVGASAAFLLAVPCTEDETSEPETWMKCIERLDEIGRYADAERQRDLLKEAFPDFEPETNND